MSEFDAITDFKRIDRIIAPFSVATTTLEAILGNTTSLTSSAIAVVLTPLTFTANSAAAFTAAGYTGTFIAFNDSRAGFQADSDSIILLQGFTLSPTNYVDLI